MTLKPIVASMFLMGLASSSAFAATSNSDTQVQLDAMKAKIAKMEAVLQQNQTGGFQQTNDWFKRITLSGIANVDATAANRSPLTMANGSTSDLTLATAVLLMDANVSDWTKVHLALAYGSQTAFDRTEHHAYGTANYGAANSSYNYVPGGNNHLLDNHDFIVTNDSKRVLLDEAYVTLGNLARSPFFARLGRQYVNFGVYNRYPMTPSLTQVLSQTSAVAATVGFVDASGFYGSAYLYRGLPRSDDAFYNSNPRRTRVQNYGANLGFAGASNNVGYKLDVSAIRNMADVDAISNVLDTNALNNASYIDPVLGMSVHASLNSGPFDAKANYVTAMKRFNVNDAGRNFQLNADNTISGQGAKPSAWGVELGYSFATMGHASRASIGYQGSKEVDSIYKYTRATIVPTGAAFGVTGNTLIMPKQRYIADYTVNVSQYTDIGVQVYNDRGFAYGYNTAAKENATVGIVRLGVKFA